MSAFENKENKTIKLLLDRSGSMKCNGMLTALISGSNSLLFEQKQVSEELNEDVNVEIYVFDNELLLVRTCEIKEISEILQDEVMPRGTTSLNDSLAKVLEDGKDQSNVTLFIFTDGQENSSILHPGTEGKKYCKNLVETLTNDNKWTVLFGAANIDAYSTGNEYGISNQNAFNVNTDSVSVSNMMRGISNSMRQASQTGEDIDVTCIDTTKTTNIAGTKRKNEDFGDNLSKAHIARS